MQSRLKWQPKVPAGLSTCDIETNRKEKMDII